MTGEPPQASHVRFAGRPLAVAWTVQEAHPELWRALCEREPKIAAIADALVADPPSARDAAPFFDPPFYRPPGSYRCFYRLCSGEPDKGRLSVLAIKGTEPAMDDLAAALRGFDRPCYSAHTVLEHLVFEEQKIPFGLGEAEALCEAQNAGRLQSAHLGRYGDMARAPLPIAVLRLPAPAAERALKQLKAQLSAAAFEVAEPRVRQGLAAYIYYYPTPPVRATDVEALLAGLSHRRRTLALIGVCDPQAVAEGWAHSFARMLTLGFLPGTLAALRTGICCQAQNACLDGGFVDLGSLTALGDLRTDGAINAALQFCTDALIGSVRALLLGRSDLVRDDQVEGRFDLAHLRRYVALLIERALAAERSGGHFADARITDFFAAPQDLDVLFRYIASYWGSEGEAAREAATTFDPAWRELVLSTQYREAGEPPAGAR